MEFSLLPLIILISLLARHSNFSTPSIATVVILTTFSPPNDQAVIQSNGNGRIACQVALHLQCADALLAGC